VNVLPTTWWVLLYATVILATAVLGDLANGVPGEMRWYLTYQLPSLLMVATVDPLIFLFMYQSICIAYLIWSFAFASARGIGGTELWTPDGGNMVAIIVTLLIVPWVLYLPAAFVAVALTNDQIAIQQEVAAWVLQAREMERFMRLLTLAATSQI